MNRKLIRTTLAEVKDREATAHKDHADGARPTAANSEAVTPVPSHGRKKATSVETNAEAFYYKKQMEARTPMIIVLQDGEQIEGVIEWYDRAALKVHRKAAPNILLLKHSIKYMFKAEERREPEPDETNRLT